MESLLAVALSFFFLNCFSPEEVQEAEDKQAKLQKQSTLGSFFKVKAAAPPTMLQRLLENKQASKKLQEARAAGQQLVVLTTEELQQTIRDHAALRGTPGRPKLPPVQTQDLVAGLAKKGRASFKRRRVEETAGTKAVLAEELLKLSEAAASPAEFKRVAVSSYQKPWKTLKKILENREVWHERAKQLQLGASVQTKKRGVANQHLKRSHTFGRGCRKGGAGRKDAFAANKQRVKAWLERERMMQHAVDGTDLLEAFLDDLQDEITLLERKEQGYAAPAKKPELYQTERNLPGFELVQSLEEYVQGLPDVVAKQRLAECRDRLTRLSENLGYRKSFGARLLKSVKGRMHRPGRLTTLTMQEEEQNVMETWMEFDAAVNLAAFGSEADLMQFVDSPADFVSRRQDLVIGWSDQIPCWLKMSRGPQIYAEFEKAKSSRLKTADFKKLEEERMQKAVAEASDLLQHAKEIEDEQGAADTEADAAEAAPDTEADTAEAEVNKAVVEVLQAEQNAGDTTLRRGVGASEDEKWRCTVEHRMILKNYLKPGADPEAEQWRPALIVKTASHCRLSNIAEDGTWKETEQFEAAGKVFVREKGRSAGRILEPWRKIRSQGLLQNWEIYGQPAAVTDGVIQQWMLQEQGQQFPCSIWVRDSVGSSWSPEVQVSMKLAHQIGVKIRGGITDLVQPTDTDFAMSLKASLKAAQAEKRRE